MEILEMCKNKCCPTIEVHSDKILIVDDEDKYVVLTKKQFKDFIEKTKNGDFDRIIADIN